MWTEFEAGDGASNTIEALDPGLVRLAPHPRKGAEMANEDTTLTDEEIETRSFAEPLAQVADADQDDPDADTADSDTDDTDADTDADDADA